MPLIEVARQTVEPFDGLSQIEINGPPVSLGSRATLTLSLVLHELTTNAAKYGALSVPDGCIDLSWTEQDDNLHLCWRERDGPHVQAPTRSGFGSRLIDRGFGKSSQVTRRFLETGLEVEIVVPKQELLN